VTAIKIDTFGGMVPAVADKLLPVSAAARSENTWLYSGELIGLRLPTKLRDCVLASTGKVYRLPNSYSDAKHLSDSVWMEFENPDTDVVPAAVIGDTFDRHYWASSPSPPMYSPRSRIAASQSAYILGIPSPDTAPGVVPTGGSATIAARAYVYTWVSAYGEEGPPSPATNVTNHPDASWAITLTAPLSGDTTGRNLTRTRIYRAITSASGVTTFFLVTELAIGTLTYTDTLTDAVVALNSILESTNWIGPPADLKGMVSMPNGIIAGFRENEIWFSEPFRPHAWPAAYAEVVDFPVVGLGVVGQTLVVCTAGYPATATGTHPSIMTMSKLTQFEPCLSRGSILSSTEGVYYASPNGLILVASGQVTNVTKDLLTKDKWMALVELPTLRAARLGSAYYAFGSSRFGVFYDGAFDSGAFAQEDFSGARTGLLIDPLQARLGFNILSNDEPSTNVMNDQWSSELFVIRANKLYWLDLTDSAPTYEPYIWKSKIFQTNDKKNLAAMRIYFTVPASTAAQNPVRNENAVQVLAADQYGIVRVYGDGVLVTTRELRTSGEIMRIVSGQKCDTWQFEIEARVRVSALQAGTSVKALASV